MTKARDLANSADVFDTVSTTELGYLDGVTSAVQTQIDSKLATATAASTYQAIVSGVSDTEIGYLDGVTSSIQSQIDGKNPVNLSINSQSSGYTLVLSDAAKLVEMSGGGTLTVPANSSVAFSVGSQVNILQTGASQVTVAGAGGVTVNATPGLKLRTQWSSATLIKRATDTWVLVGDLSA